MTKSNRQYASRPNEAVYIPPQPCAVPNRYNGFNWLDENNQAMDIPAELDELAFTADLGMKPFYVLALQFPPTSNKYWRKGKHGNVYRSEHADAYISLIKYICAAAGIDKPITGSVETYLYVWRDNAARDLDNCVKILYDALQGYVYVNDKQICQQKHVRDYDDKRPRVLLFAGEVTAADEWKVKELEKKQAATERRRLKKLLAEPVT